MSKLYIDYNSYVDSSITRGWKMVKHLAWRDLSWSTTNTKIASNTNSLVHNSRTQSSLPKTNRSFFNTSPSIQKPTQSTLFSKIRNTEGKSLLQRKETFVTRTNQTSKSKNTDSNATRSSSQPLTSINQPPWSTQQVSLGVKATRPTTQEVNLPPKQTPTSPPATKQPRKAPTSHQVECHRHADYMHCGVMITVQDSMMVGLVGGYTALALIVAVSLISIWASKYLPFFLKMWWIKASSAQTYDVNI